MERGDDAVEGFPASGSLAGAAVDNKVVRVLGDVGVQVIHKHAQGRFLDPALASSRCTARRTNRTRTSFGKCGRGHKHLSPRRLLKRRCFGHWSFVISHSRMTNDE